MNDVFADLNNRFDQGGFANSYLLLVRLKEI